MYLPDGFKYSDMGKTSLRVFIFKNRINFSAVPGTEFIMVRFSGPRGGKFGGVCLWDIIL